MRMNEVIIMLCLGIATVIGVCGIVKYQQRQFAHELDLLEEKIDFEIKQIDDTMKYYEQRAERKDEEFKKRLEKMSEEYDKEWEIRKKYMSKEEN